MNWKYVVIFGFHLLMSMFFPDFWQNPNSTSRVLGAHSLVHTGSLKIDEHHELTMDKCLIGDHYYSEKAPLPIYMAAGVYFLAYHFGFAGEPDNLSPVYFIGDLFSAIGLSLVITMLFFLVVKHRPALEAFLLSALPFYGSFIYVFTGTFFSHVISGAMMVMSYVSFKKEHWIVAGVWSGMAFLSEFLLILMPVVWIGQLIWQNRWRPAVKFAMTLLPFGVFMLLYNYVIGGDAFTMLYKYTNNSKDLYGLGIPNPEVIFELLIPDYRGILFYMPVLIFFVIHFSLQKKFSVRNLLNDSVLMAVIVYFLAFSSFHDWWGGWSYGPRQLIPMAMLLAFYSVEKLMDKKYNHLIFFGACLIGWIMATMAKVTVIYSLPTNQSHPFFTIILKKFMNAEFNQQHLMGYLFGASAIWSILVWIVLFIGLTFVIRIYPDFFHKSNIHEQAS